MRRLVPLLDEDGHRAPNHLHDWRNFVPDDWKGLAHRKREQRETGRKLLYTIEELANLAGVSVKTLRRRQAAGEMPLRWWDIPKRQYFYYVRDLAEWRSGWSGVQRLGRTAATMDAKDGQT